jgi:hypothetical protein
MSTSQNFAVNEKRKSLNSSKCKDGQIIEARVVANYGDPGIDEDYGFDLLSRFLIVSIESCYRIPTTNSWHRNLAIVFRPKNLWINAEEGLASSPSEQKRSDAFGNINQGLSSSSTLNGIPRIDSPYRINEVIKIKKLPNSVKNLSNDPVFDSVFNNYTDENYAYNSWHNEGSTFPYFAGNESRTEFLKTKTLFKPYEDTAPFRYGMCLHKYQYESFFFNVAIDNQELTDYVFTMFEGELENTNPIYTANGGYIFNKYDSVKFMSIDYEDINVTNKQRLATNDCLPLIVTTPQSFPTPKVRNTSLLSYNPTYSTIVKNN